MSLKIAEQRDWTEWAERVVENLRTSGYFYDRNFSSNVDHADAIVQAARSLGSLLIPSATDAYQPVLLTRPSIRAPKWRPFDRRESIGWHNDFSTRPGRPDLSLSWIRHEDPAGSCVGAWRVASVRAVLSELTGSVKGRRLVGKLSKEAHPFGYMDAGRARSFRVISQRGLRFYGRALTEGARIALDRVPEETQEAIAMIEEAADAVGETLPASKGALLVVDNWFSLHDRTEQTVAGTKARRQAWLCFVKKLHRPFFRSYDSIAMGGAQAGTR